MWGAIRTTTGRTKQETFSSVRRIISEDGMGVTAKAGASAFVYQKRCRILTESSNQMRTKASEVSSILNFT